jgi:FkbH-like protein
LLGVKPDQSAKAVRVYVARNSAAELLTRWIDPFLSFSDLKADLKFSEYDDTFSGGPSGSADLVLIYFDISRIPKANTPALEHLDNRFHSLSRQAKSCLLIPKFVLNAPERQAAIDFSTQIAQSTGSSVLALPTWVHGLSMNNCSTERSWVLELARWIGMSYIPAVMGRRIKLIVLDLDNTLYDGVLAEDGIASLRTDVQHRAAFEQLKDLKDRGIILAICTHNDAKDVQDLIEGDLLSPLESVDFTYIEAGWRPKSAMVQSVIKQMNISTKDVLILDDNPGVVFEIAEVMPAAHTVLVKDATDLLAACRWYPGLSRLVTTKEDLFRSDDLRLNEVRKELAKSPMSGYFKKLKPVVTLEINPMMHIQRLAELSMKTNQFNTNLRRLTVSDMVDRMTDAQAIVISIGLRDELIDSGVIGLISGRLHNSRALLDDIAVSCRALGRSLEAYFLDLAIKRAAESWQITPQEVLVDYRKGNRNEVAQKWLGVDSHDSKASGVVNYQLRSFGPEFDLVHVAYLEGAASERS